jgi:ribosomal protein S18 acetylase RimI-like enzyme
MRIHALDRTSTVETWEVPAVPPLIQQAGNPYFNWLFGDLSTALPIIESRMRADNSELSLLNTVLARDSSDQIVGALVALTGNDLAKRRMADAAAYLQLIGRPERAPFMQRLQASRNLFASVQSDEFYLSKLGVQQKARRLGYGRILVERFLSMGTAQGLDSFVLDVSADNAAAIGLYSSLGFQVTAQACTEAGDLTYLTMRLKTSRTSG